MPCALEASIGGELDETARVLLMDAWRFDAALEARDIGRSLAANNQLEQAEALYETSLALLEDITTKDVREEINFTLVLQGGIILLSGVDMRDFMEKQLADAEKMESRYLPQIAQILWAVRVHSDDLEAAVEVLGMTQDPQTEYDLLALEYSRRIPTPA